MTQQIINTGSGPDSYTGDTLRTAFTKVNDNFSQLYAGNVGGNIIVANVTASGNVTADYFFGDGSNLTGIVATANYANSNVASYLPVYTGNVNAAYYFGNGRQLTGIVATSSYGNSNVASYLPVYTGNVNAAYYFGNARFVTGLTSTSLGNLTIGGPTNQDIIGTVAGSIFLKPFDGNNVVIQSMYDSSGVYANLVLGADVNGVSVRTGSNATGRFPGVTFQSNGASIQLNKTSNEMLFTASAASGFDYNFANGSLYSKEFYADANSPTGYQFTTNAGLTGLNHTYQNDVNGNISLIKISHDNSTPAKFYENNTSILAGNLVVLQTGSSSGSFPNAFVQTYSTANTYAQLIWQNLSNRGAATGDIVITSDNGTDTTNYIDMGMTGSGYDNTGPNNSLGTSVNAKDGYLYVKGSNDNVSGNLTIGTVDEGTVTKILAGGVNEADVTATVSNVGITVNKGNVTLSQGDLNFNGGDIWQSSDNDLVVTVQDDSNDDYALYNRVTDSGTLLGETRLRRGDFRIDFPNTSKNFNFDDSGILGLPGDISLNTQGGDISLYAIDDGDSGSAEIKTISYAGGTLGSNVRVTQNNATISTANAAHIWKFDNTGILTLPGEGVVRSNNDTIILQSYDTGSNIGRGLRIGDTGGLYLEQGTDPAWLTFNPSSGNADIYAGPGVSGAGGHHLNLTAGFSDTVTWNSNPGGDVNIQGGYGSFGDGGGGPGGEVNIIGGASSDSHAGNVHITVGGSDWTFDYNGNVTIPGSINAGLPTTSPAPKLTGFDINSEIIVANNITILGNLSGNINANISVSQITNSNSSVTIDSTGNVNFILGGANFGHIQYGGGVAIGSTAGNSNQGLSAVAIGSGAATENQGYHSVAIGWNVGQYNQGTSSIAIGENPAFAAQGNSAIAIGVVAARSGQGNYAIAMGTAAGYSGQTANAVAIGTRAGQYTQGDSSIAIGYFAANSGQSADAVAIGSRVAQVNQGQYAVAIGRSAGNNSQGGSSVAVGASAGEDTQGVNSVAVGGGAAYQGQGNASTALGYVAGEYNQGNFAVAVGSGAAYNGQGDGAIAIGADASPINQGDYSIAIGAGASVNSLQPANSIIIDATSNQLAATGAGFFVAPVRSADGANVSLSYNTSTKEISYSANTFVSNTYVPSTAGAAGTIGQISFDGSYVYICVANNTWKRANIATW